MWSYVIAKNQFGHFRYIQSFRGSGCYYQVMVIYKVV